MCPPLQVHRKDKKRGLSLSHQHPSRGSRSDERQNRNRPYWVTLSDASLPVSQNLGIPECFKICRKDFFWNECFCECMCVCIWRRIEGRRLLKQDGQIVDGFWSQLVWKFPSIKWDKKEKNDSTERMLISEWAFYLMVEPPASHMEVPGFHSWLQLLTPSSWKYRQGSNDASSNQVSMIHGETWAECQASFSSWAFRQ